MLWRMEGKKRVEEKKIGYAGKKRWYELRSKCKNERRYLKRKEEKKKNKDRK